MFWKLIALTLILNLGLSQSGAKANTIFETSPKDLANYKTLLTKSLALVTCGAKSGVAVSLSITFDDEFLDSGWNSMLFSTKEVIDSCLLGQRNVSVEYLGKTYQGIVWTWSEEEDLAAIATTVRIPTVSWQTERPAPEWWLATGTFTKGYGVNFEISKIAIVNEKDFTMLTSKPITLGSSGVAFTRAGTFLGIVTNSKSPGLGIVRILGRPLMCQSSNGTKSVIVCKDFRENQWKQGVSNSDGSTLSESSLKVYDAFKAFYNQAIINWESILSVQSKASKTLKLRFLKTPLGKEGDSIINDIKNIIPRIDDAISKSVSASDDQFLDKSSPLSIGSVYDQLFKEYESLSSRMSEFDEKYSGYSPGFLCKSGSTINFAVKFKCASGQKKVKVKEFTLIN